MRTVVVGPLLAVAVLAFGCDDELDCFVYGEKWGQLVVRDDPPRPQDRDEIERRMRAIYGDACRAGNVSAEQYQCVMNTDILDFAEACLER